MENYLHYLVILISGVVAYFTLSKKISSSKTKTFDEEVKKIDGRTTKVPDTTTAVDNINKTGAEITTVENTIREKEKGIENQQNTDKPSEPLTDATSAANWVNNITNKVPVILFLCISNFVFAADPLFPGKPYTPKQEGVALSLAELNTLKEKVEKAEKLEKLNSEYVSLLEDYKKLKELQNQQIKQYSELDKLKQESIVIYKEAITSYKDIIGEMRENSLKQEKQINQQRRMSRFQRNLNFILGFAAPILGARALDQLGR